MTNKRKTGDQTENRVFGKVKHLGFRKTANSGARFGDHDMSHPDWVTEIKKKSTEGASVAKSELSKLKAEAEKQGKDWLFICENQKGNQVAMTDLDAFIAILEKIEEYLTTYNDAVDDILLAGQPMSNWFYNVSQSPSIAEQNMGSARRMVSDWDEALKKLQKIRDGIQ
jgi:hypothetical protein